ncbi:MAG: hypothetical protein RL020_1797 [Pseudomonadota bacterium]|jgi:hypothetical protein
MDEGGRMKDEDFVGCAMRTRHTFKVITDV